MAYDYPKNQQNAPLCPCGMPVRASFCPSVGTSEGKIDGAAAIPKEEAENALLASVKREGGVNGRTCLPDDSLATASIY